MGLEDELAEEYGKVNVVVEPTLGSATPLEPDSPAPAAPPATAEGAQAVQEGTVSGEEQQSVQATDEDDPDDLTTTDSELTPEEEEALKRLEDYLAEQREMLRKEIREEELPKVQSGLDRKIAALEQEREQYKKELEEVNRQIREQSIAHLPEKDQEEIRKGWATQDKARENDAYADELVKYHDDLEAMRLGIEYGEYGVTAEELAEIEPDQRLVYCKDKQIEWIKEHPDQVATRSTNGSAKKPEAVPTRTTQPSQQRQPVPAGARAPSDTGGSAAPNPAPKQVEGKGVDAMANSIADRDSWETVSFPRSRSG